MITGSAMRKPRIQPGRGLGSADSMIDGRTIDTGHVAAVLQQGPLAEGLGVGVGVGPAERGGAGPAGLDHLVVHPRGCGAARSWPASAGVPAAPSSARASLRKRVERLGSAAVGLGVGAGPAGAVDLGPPVDVDEERALVHRLLGRRAAPVAGHVAGGHGDEVGRDAEVAAASATIRVGPRRLTSTAASSGESNDTVAAEWMTMSQRGQGGAAVVVEAEPVACRRRRRSR